MSVCEGRGVLHAYDDAPPGVFLSMLQLFSCFVWIWTLIAVCIHILRGAALSAWLNAREAKVQAASWRER
jgi:hypothetical protein